MKFDRKMNGKTIRRAIFFLSLILLCFCGLTVRRWNGASPNFFNTYFPDAAWTMAVYCGLGLLFCRGARCNTVFALLVSYFVECSQLLHTPFLESIRAVKIGGLILGYGFLWSDLICYTVGAFLCGAIEFAAEKTLIQRK